MLQSSLHRCLLCDSPVVMGVTLHSFPKYEPYRTHWIRFCNQFIETLPETSKICSQHFLPNCWAVMSRKVGDFGIGIQKFLKYDAVPTIFPESCSSLKRRTNSLMSKLMTPKISQKGKQTIKKRSPEMMRKLDPENMCKSCIVCDAQRSATIQLHKIPSKVSIKMAWLEFVEQCLPDFNSKDVTISMIHVCSNHFDDQNYAKNAGKVVPNPGGRQLVPYAVPSIHWVNKNNETNINIVPMDNDSDSEKNITITVLVPRPPDIIQNARMKLSRILNVNVAKTLSHKKKNTYSDSASIDNLQSVKEKEKMNLLKPIYPNSCTPYFCPNERCGEGFLDVNLLTEHEKLHFLSDSSYTCHICNANFVSYRSYDNHLTRHFGSEHRFCAQCSAAFSTKNQLLKHISQNHKISMIKVTSNSKRNKRRRGRRPGMRNHEHIGDHVVDIAGQRFEIEIDNSGLHDEETEGAPIEEFCKADNKVEGTSNPGGVESLIGKVVEEGQEAVPEGVSDDYFMGDYVYEDAEDAIESDEEYIVPYFPSSDDHCDENDDGPMDFTIIDEELKNQSTPVDHERPESTKGKSSKNQIHQHLSNCEENVDTIIDCVQVRPNVSRKNVKALIHRYSSENVDITTESNQGRQETTKSQQSSYCMESADSLRESGSVSTNKFSNVGQDPTSPVLDEINIVSQVSLGNTIEPPENVTQKSCFRLERRREDPILPENNLPATQQELSSISIKSPKKCYPERRKKRRTDPILSPVGDSPLPPLVSSKRNRKSTEKADKVKVEDEILCSPVTFDLTAVKRRWMRLKLKHIDSVFPMLKVKGFVDLSQCSEKQNYLIKGTSASSIFENLIEKAKLSSKQEDNEIDDSPGFEDVMKDFLKELGPQKFKQSTTCTPKIRQTKLDTASRKRPGKKMTTRKTQSKVRKLTYNPRESTNEMSEITSSKESLPCKPKKLNSRQERSGLEQESPLKKKAFNRSVFVELSDIFESSPIKPQIKKSPDGFNISDDNSFCRNLHIKLKKEPGTIIENLETIVRQVCVTPSKQGNKKNEETDESSEDLVESIQTADNKNEQPRDQQSVRNEAQFSESSNKISLDSNGIVEYLPLRQAAGELTKQRKDTTNMKEQPNSQLDYGMDRNKETVGCARSLSESQRGGISRNVSTNSDPEDNSPLVNTSSLNEPQRGNMTTDTPGEISKLSVETPNEDVVEFGSLAELESKTSLSTKTSPNPEPLSTLELVSCKSSVKNSPVLLQIDLDASKFKPSTTPESPQGSKIRSIPSGISPQSLSFLHSSSFIETLQTIRAQTLDQAAKTSYDYSQIESLNEDKDELHTEFLNNVQARDTETPIVGFQNRLPTEGSENPTTVFLVNSPAEAYVPHFGKSVNAKEPDASEYPTDKLENEREEIDKSDNNVSRTNKTNSWALGEPMQSSGESLSEIVNLNQTSDDDHHNHTEGYVMAINDEISDQESQEFLQEDSVVINRILPHLAESENSNSRDSFSTDEDKTKTNVTEFERKMPIAKHNAVSEGRIQQFPEENVGPEKNCALFKESNVGLKTGGKIKGSKNRRRGVDFGRKKGRWSKKNTKSSYLKYKYHKESSLYLQEEGALVGNSSNGYPVITGCYSSHGDLKQIELVKIPDNSRLTGHDIYAGGAVVQTSKSDSSDITTYGETTSKRKTANLQKIFKYACVYCGQGFHPREKFDDHKMFHNNMDINFYTEYYKKEVTRQNTCKNCSQCGNSFPSMKLLNQHFISHLTCKSFTCSICYAVFPRSSMVLKHKVEDHGVVKQFICSLCSYCFDDEYLLNSHLINDCKVVQFSTKGTGNSNIPNEEKIFPLIDFHV